MPPNRNQVGLNRFLLYQQRALALIALLLTNPYNREFWVHPFNTKVHSRGEFFVTYPDLRRYPVKFFRSCRMSIRQFGNLLLMVSPIITKQNNNYTETLSAEEKLVMTLR